MNLQVQIVLNVLLLLTGCTGAMPNLGVENGRLMDCPATPNCVNSQAKDKKHFIEPLRITGTPLEAKSHILKILSAMRRSTITESEDNYIKVEFVSSVFRFVDDVEFYVTNTESNETIIHVRSASRVGHSDFGVNRKRIEQIRSKLAAISRE